MSFTATALFPPLPIVLVLGASGMLGRAVHQAFRMSLATQASVVGTAHSRTQGGLVPCDVTNETSLRELLASQAPQVVINCVAERRPDVVEKEPAKAQVLNVRLVEVLAEESARLRFYLVHISTDYVFDGTKPPYKPYDPPHPLNVYGEHKLAAEEVLRRGHGGVQNYVILRVPVLFGDSVDLAESSVTLLARDVLLSSSPLSLPPSASEIKDKGTKRQDDWAARYATRTGDVARVLATMVGKALQQQHHQHQQHQQQQKEGGALQGIFHFSSKEKRSAREGDEKGGRAYTKYSMSLVIGEILGKSTKHLEPDPDPPRGLPRPKDCELDITSLQAALGEDMTKARPLREGLTEVLRKILGG